MESVDRDELKALIKESFLELLSQIDVRMDYKYKGHMSPRTDILEIYLKGETEFGSRLVAEYELREVQEDD